MKKLIFIVLIVLNSELAKSQKPDIKFCLEELNQFTKNNNIEFYKIYEEDLRVIIIYKDGVILNLIIKKTEKEEVSSHEMHFSYFFPINILTKKESFNDILNLIQNNLNNNSFGLKEFVLNSIKNAQETKKEEVESCENTLKIISIVDNQDSEVVFILNQITGGLNCQLDFYLSL